MDKKFNELYEKFEKSILVNSEDILTIKDGEVFSNYISLKSTFGDDYWNHLELPVEFINNVINKYIEIAKKWRVFSDKHNIECNIFLNIFDPHYIKSDLTIVPESVLNKSKKSSCSIPEKFLVSNDKKLHWERKEQYDEFSWKLNELTNEEMKDLKNQGYEMIKLEDKYYRGEMSEVGDMIFRKKIGDIWTVKF